MNQILLGTNRPTDRQSGVKLRSTGLKSPCTDKNMNISNDLSNPPRTLKGNKLGTYVYPLRQDTAKLKSEREDSRADRHDAESKDLWKPILCRKATWNDRSLAGHFMTSLWKTNPQLRSLTGHFSSSEKLEYRTEPSTSFFN